MTLSLLSVIMGLICNACADPNPDPIPPVKPIQIAGTPLDSRWQITTALAAGSWSGTGLCFATSGEGRGKASITAVSDCGAPLLFGSNSGLSVTGLREGDYFLFCVPMEDLPAQTDIDFFLTIDVIGDNAPEKWIFEHYENDAWQEGRSFNTYGSSNTSNTSFIEHFTTSAPIKNDTLKIRTRVISGGSQNASSVICQYNFEGCRILAYPESKYPQAKDTKKVLALGNSFSFYYAPVWMMKEIARSEGHQMDLRMNIKGGQTFGQHLSLTLSKEAALEGGYDYAILQDQSTKHSGYYGDPSSSASKKTLSDTKSLVELIKSESKDCQIILENTWSYSVSNYMGFGSYAAFDNALQQGAASIAQSVNAKVSPIGPAFSMARDEGLEMEYLDYKHQSEYGAYLKACVNYLLIYGGTFSENVSDCNLPHNAALKLRSIAEIITK